MKHSVGQPTERWTKQRRKSQARSAKRAWDKVSPMQRIERNSRRVLAQRPMNDDDYDGFEIDFVTGFFWDRVAEILKWPSGRFYAYARKVGIDEGALQAFRAKFLLTYAPLGDDDE